MNFLSAVLLGVVEGITEFLPVSSTGHLVLISDALKIPKSDFLKTFEIAIQSGAILAVVALYWRAFLNTRTLQHILLAFIPTGFIGLFVYPFFKQYLLENSAVVLVALIVGGILLIVAELYLKRRLNKETLISGKRAFWVGVFQSIAIIPGVSRSGATIVGGLFLGIPRTQIVEFSFLLAVPTIAMATGYDLLNNAHAFQVGDLRVLAVGLVSAFFTALIAIKFLSYFSRNHSLISFGIYRILLAVLFFFTYY